MNPALILVHLYLHTFSEKYVRLTYTKNMPFKLNFSPHILFGTRCDTSMPYMHAKTDVTMSNSMFLSDTSRINCIVANLPDKRCIYIYIYSLNDVANDAESTQKSIITSIIASLKSEPTCKLINRIPGYQVYQARLQERMLNRSANLAIQQAFSKPCLVNLISNYTYLESVLDKSRVT